MRRRSSLSSGLWVLLFVFLFGVPVAWAQPVIQQGPNLGTQSIGPNQIPLTATGGTGPYTWAIVGGALPPGMSLRADTDTWFPANASAGIVGVATTPGNYNFTLQVTSGGLSSSRAFTYRISPLLIKDTWELPHGFLGRPYSGHTLTALNNTGAVTWSATSGLPPGMTLSPTGVLSGTPTVAGFYNVQLRLQDSVDTVFRGLNLSVFAIEITTPGLLPDATQNQPYTATIQASGGTPPYTFSTCSGIGCLNASSGLPSGLAIDESTGQITGTTTVGAGKFGFDLVVTDSNHVSVQKRMAIPVVSTPHTLPRIGPYGNDFGTCTLSWPCNLGIHVNNGPGPYTWSASGLPPGMSVRFGTDLVSWVTPGDGEVWGSPTQSGVFNVTLTATDATGASVTNTFPLRVTPLVVSNYPVNGTFGVPYSHRFRIYGGPTAPAELGPAVVDYKTLYTAEHIAGVLPTGLTFNPTEFLISGTSADTGNHFVSFRFTDQLGQRVDIQTAVFIEGDDGSTIQVQTASNLGSVNSGSFATRQLFACCAPALAWSFVDGALPPGMTLSQAGLLSGVPTTTGTYEFRVRVEDATFAGNFAIRNFRLTVVSPTAFFITTPNLPFANVGTPISIEQTVSGATGSITWALAQGSYLPPGITLSSSTGTLSGTPTFMGLYTFSVTATDSAGAVASRFFSIAIYPAGQTPPLNLSVGPNFNLLIGQFTVQLAPTGGLPPYHYSLTPGAPTIPGMRVLDGPPLPLGFASTSGAFAGVITTGGVYTTSIRATDSAGAIVDRPITLTVSPLRILSDSTPPRPSVGVPYSFTLIPFGGSGNYSWTLNNLLPPGLTLDSSGQISGTPTAAGAFNVSITLRDLVTSHFAQQNFAFNVNPFALETSPILPQGTVGVPYSQQLSAPGCGTGCTWTGFPSSGLTLSTGGLISGTPSFTTNTFFTVTVTGSNGTAQRVFSLLIANNVLQPVTITTGPTLGPTIVGSAATFVLSVSGGRGPYTWALRAGDALPPGMRLEQSGDLSGANLGPGFGYLLGRVMQVGFYTFTLDVTDSAGLTASRTFTWNVSALSNQYGSLPITGTMLVYGTPYVQPLLVIGGTGDYTWTATGTLPPGLALDADTGVVSGTPTNTGSFSVPIQVSDDAGNFTTTTLSFTIAGATGTSLTFNFGPSFGVVVRGFTLNFNVTPSGGTGPYTVTALTPLPPGFVLLSGDSAIGTAAPGTFAIGGVAMTSGAFSFTLRAEDSLGNFAVRTVAVVVSSVGVVASNLPDATVGVPYSQAIVANDTIGPIAWSAAANAVLPPGLTLTPAGAVQGTPTQAATYSFQVFAQDSAGSLLSVTVSLRVSTISIDGESILPNAITGQPYSHTLSATGGGAGLLWSATGLPAGLTMSSTGTISGVASNIGTFSVFVTATDGGVPVTRRFALFTRAVNPTVLEILGGTTLSDIFAGQSILITLTPAGGVPPYTLAVAPGSSLPPGLTLVAGSVSPLAFNPGSTVITGVVTTPGLYTFTLMATDSTGAETRRTFTLRVSAVVLSPTGPRSATAGVAYAQQLTAIGGTPPYTFSMSPTSVTQDMLPPGFTFSTSGLIAGTTTSTGNYVFDVTVTDSAGRVFVRRYTLLVNNALGLRIINTNPPDAAVGTGRAMTLSTSGPSTYTWSIAAGNLPPGVSLSGSGTTGTLIGAPSVPGVYTFSVRATDNANGANAAQHTFTYRVLPMQIVSPPVEFQEVAELPPGQVGAPYSHTLRIAGGTPPYAVTLTPRGALPAGVSLSASGVLSGIPEQTGNYQIPFTIADSTGQVLNGFSLRMVVHAGAAPPLVQNFDGLPDPSVGAPYVFPLDIVVRGGRAPFSWAIAPGFSLPPGLTILPGTNGVQSHVGGVATTPGDYFTNLIVTDASGQTLPVPLGIHVSSLALSPGALAPGRVGVPLSVALVPSGGIAPYSIETGEESDMPPGLSLSAAGVLSGTPTHPGNFLMFVLVTDAADTTLFRVYFVTIDNAAGEAPAISLAPRPIQVYHELGAAGPVSVPVNVNGTSGALPFTLSMAGVPNLTLSTSAGVAPGTTTLNLNLTGLAVGTYVGILGASAPTAANQFDAVPVTLTVAPTPPCEFSVNPTSATSPAAGGLGSFSVSAGRTCVWTAIPSDPWIIILSGAVGSGPRSVSYRTLANTGISQRTGRITVNGEVHSITQFGTGCSFGIVPATLPATAAGGSAAIQMTASNAACTWTASGLDASPASGAGSRTVTVVVPPNPDPLSRTLTATIAGQTLTVDQAGVGCTASLSPYDATAPAAGGTGSVTVTMPAGCGYATVLGPSWITVSSGASGAASGTLVYSVDANSATVARSGTLTIGGQPFQITQSAVACSVTIGTSALGSPYGSAGGGGSISINTNGANCAWTASSDAAWATLSAAGGTGNGSTALTIASNAGSPSPRTGTVTINGQSINITQAGTTCLYALQSDAGTVPGGGGSGTVGVVAPTACAWTSASNNLDWLTITASGTAGTSDVRFAATANPSTTPRVGTLTIAGLTYTLTQAGAPCSYTLPVPEISVAPDGLPSGSFGYSTSVAGCTPVPLSFANWVTVTSTTPNGATGTVTYSVEPNPSSVPRVGTIQVGDRNFTITQLGGQCGFSLNAYGALFNSSGGNRTLLGSQSALGCAAPYGTDQPGFITLGTLTEPTNNIFTLPYDVSSFSALTVSIRIGRINLGGAILTIKQTSY